MAESDPFSVTVDCPTDGCPQALVCRWPPDNPDSVTVRCHRCDQKTEIHRDQADDATY